VWVGVRRAGGVLCRRRGVQAWAANTPHWGASIKLRQLSHVYFYPPVLLLPSACRCEMLYKGVRSNGKRQYLDANLAVCAGFTMGALALPCPGDSGRGTGVCLNAAGCHLTPLRAPPPALHPGTAPHHPMPSLTLAMLQAGRCCTLQVPRTRHRTSWWAWCPAVPATAAAQRCPLFSLRWTLTCPGYRQPWIQSPPRATCRKAQRCQGSRLCRRRPLSLLQRGSHRGVRGQLPRPPQATLLARLAMPHPPQARAQSTVPQSLQALARLGMQA